MGDFELRVTSEFDWDLPDENSGPDSPDLDLRTAVILSLFTERRAEPGELPPGHTDPRGYWADELGEVPGDKWGSRLWTLAREKVTPQTLARAREYAEEGLAWLVDDGIASAVTVSGQWEAGPILALLIQIKKPDGREETFRFSRAWASEAALV